MKVVGGKKPALCGTYTGVAWSDEVATQLEPCRLTAGHEGDHDPHPEATQDSTQRQEEKPS